MDEQAFSAAIGDWSARPPHPRFGIYRNNVASALIAALRVRYPVTEELVGQEFFAAMAGVFAEANRPMSPVLISYGEAFPDFIRSFPPAADVAYLGDVAALESLWWHAYHAADEAPVEAQNLAAIGPDRWPHVRFRFHPSFGLMSSPYAIGSIWQSHHDGTSMAAIDVRSAQRVLVARPGIDVAVRIIPAASNDFIAALSQGAGLGEAVGSMSEQHPEFDLAAQLQGLLSLNIIAGLLT